MVSETDRIRELEERVESLEQGPAALPRGVAEELQAVPPVVRAEFAAGTVLPREEAVGKGAVGEHPQPLSPG